MRAYIIRAKALHTKVIDKAVFLDIKHILTNFLIWNVMGDEAQRNWEPVSLECAKRKRLENALKASAADFLIPVLAALLSNELFGIGSMNGNPLSRRAALILIASNLELLGHLAYAFGDVVHCLHRVYVSLVDRNFQVLRLRGIFWLTIVHFHTLTLRIWQGRLEKELNLATFTLADSVCLVQFYVTFKELVDLGPSLLLCELFLKH